MGGIWGDIYGELCACVIVSVAWDGRIPSGLRSLALLHSNKRLCVSGVRDSVGAIGVGVGYGPYYLLGVLTYSLTCLKHHSLHTCVLGSTESDICIEVSELTAEVADGGAHGRHVETLPAAGVYPARPHTSRLPLSRRPHISAGGAPT